MSLTPHEAIGQVHALSAWAELQEEQRERAKHLRDMMDDKPVQVQATVLRGADAEKIADVPHLTGDPEWDAMELAETDPSKPLLED